MSISTLNALDAFYARLYAQNEFVIKLGLDPVRQALNLEQLKPQCPHILIAGTNGKGQTSAILSNVCSALKMRPGLFTSPHLVDFSERIRVNGAVIPPEDLLKLGTETLRRFAGRDFPEACLKWASEHHVNLPAPSDIQLTFFELSFIIALKYFQQQKIHFGVFEVGLGGRLDATNTLDPDASIITSIGMDHMAFLGHTLEQICTEKAGIFRPDRPAILGSTCAQNLLKLAKSAGCSHVEVLGNDFFWENKNGKYFFCRNNIQIPMNGAEDYSHFQLDNAAVAFATAQILHESGKLQGDVDAILENILTHTQWVGRLWQLPKAVAEKFGCAHIFMDGAHNIDGVRALCTALKTMGEPKLAFVVNSCADKAIEDMFACYQTLLPNEAFFVPPVPTHRVMQPQDYCRRVGLPVSQATASITEAIQHAADYAGTKGTVIITGSLYLLGAALRELQIDAAQQSIYV